MHEAERIVVYIVRAWRRILAGGLGIGERSAVGRVGGMGIYPYEMGEGACVVTEGEGMYTTIKELMVGVIEGE